MKLLRILRKLLPTDGIDGTIIGPYDLSASMGYAGEFERGDVTRGH